MLHGGKGQIGGQAVDGLDEAVSGSLGAFLCWDARFALLPTVVFQLCRLPRLDIKPSYEGQFFQKTSGLRLLFRWNG